MRSGTEFEGCGWEFYLVNVKV